MFIKVSDANLREPIILNTDQIVTIDGSHVVLSTGHRLDLMANSLREVMGAVMPVKRKVKNTEVNAELQEFFMKLHRLTGGNGTPVFNPAREKKLKDLMSKHKLTVEMLVKAATNIGNDAYLQGDNDNKKRYGDIDYLLRPDKAMKWAEANPVSKKRGMFNG